MSLNRGAGGETLEIISLRAIDPCCAVSSLINRQIKFREVLRQEKTCQTKAGVLKRNLQKKVEALNSLLQLVSLHF